MYHHSPVTLATKVGAAGATGSLAFTGLNTAHEIVAAATLIMLGLVLLHVIPRSEA